MNTARRRVEAAKKRNTERMAKWDEDNKAEREAFAATYTRVCVILKQPHEALLSEFAVRKDRVVTTIDNIMKNGVWHRRCHAGVLNYVPPENIAVIEVENFEITPRDSQI